MPAATQTLLDDGCAHIQAWLADEVGASFSMQENAAFVTGDGTNKASLLGYPTAEIEDMPDIGANAFEIAFGDFLFGYLIVDRHGARVLRNLYSLKPCVLFYPTKYVGGGAQNLDAIKVMKLPAS